MSKVIANKILKNPWLRVLTHYAPENGAPLPVKFLAYFFYVLGALGYCHWWQKSVGWPEIGAFLIRNDPKKAQIGQKPGNFELPKIICPKSF